MNNRSSKRRPFTLVKPYVDQASGAVKNESTNVKLHRLIDIFTNDRCIIPINISGDLQLNVHYQNLLSNVYLSDDKKISEKRFIDQCCVLTSPRHDFIMTSVTDTLMSSKVTDFVNEHKNKLPMLFLIESEDSCVPTDVLKVFSRKSESHLKKRFRESTVFVDVSKYRLYEKLLEFIFVPTGNFDDLFANYAVRKNDEEEEFFGCEDSDIRINKKSFEIKFNAALPFENPDDDDILSKYAKFFIEWYAFNTNVSPIHFSKEKIQHFVALTSVRETFYPATDKYVSEMYYRLYKTKLNQAAADAYAAKKEQKEKDDAAKLRDIILDPLGILKPHHDNSDGGNNDEEEEEVDDDGIFRVDKHDVHVYDFENFTASIFLHFFKNEPISEHFDLLVKLRKSGVLPKQSKELLLKIFGWSKRIPNCPIYNFCNNFGIYFMCKLTDHLAGKVLLCSRDSIFTSEEINDSMFDVDDFYAVFYKKHLVLENKFTKFLYSDTNHYAGYYFSPSSQKVVLKGFTRKHIPRFQIELMENLFIDYFKQGKEAFNFKSSFDSILKRFGEEEKDMMIKRFTFNYTDAVNARHLYYNRMEDELFVFSDEINHTTFDTLDSIKPRRKNYSIRTATRFYGLCYDEYLKCLRENIVKDPFVSSILRNSKSDDSIPESFENYCRLFMVTDSASYITPNNMGTHVYTAPYLLLNDVPV